MNLDSNSKNNRALIVTHLKISVLILCGDHAFYPWHDIWGLSLLPSLLHLPKTRKAKNKNMNYKY